jgi:glycosyltransferase involved in cell wall biosynthesis
VTTVKAERRVLYVNASSSLLGGAECCLLDIASRIGSQGWAPVVLLPEPGDLSRALDAAGVECVFMNLGSFQHRGEIRSGVLPLRLATAMAAAWRIRALIKKRGITVVHSNSAPVIAGGLGARLAGVPHVWHIREVLGGAQWRVLRRLITRLSARRLCISEVVARGFDGLPARDHSSLVVVRDGIDLELFGGGDERPADPPLVAMMSRIHPLKGHELFISAAALVRAQAPSVRFAMVGGCLPVYEAQQRRLEALRDQLGLSGSVEFRPHIERPRLPEFLRTLTVAVVPSRWVEPGGLVVLESMGTGVPVVATRQGGPAEVISDGVDGLLVSPTDPAELAGALLRLLGDQPLRERIAAAGRKRVEDGFSIQEQVSRLAAIYEDVTRV